LLFAAGALAFAGAFFRWRCDLLCGSRDFAAAFGLAGLLLAAGFLLAASAFLVLGAGLAAGAAVFIFFLTVMGKPVTFCSLRVAG
jgi:Zn-dependent membrane protease YugP